MVTAAVTVTATAEREHSFAHERDLDLTFSVSTPVTPRISQYYVILGLSIVLNRIRSDLAAYNGPRLARYTTG